MLYTVAIRIAAASLAFSLTACGGEEVSPHESRTERDSAGVRLVTFADGSHPDTVMLGEHFMSIGTVEGSAEYTLHDVQDVAVTDESVVVAVGTAIHWYDREGRFLHKAGGQGEGPGEFRYSINHLTVVGIDSIAATEGNVAHIFDSSGTYRRSVRFPNLPYELAALGTAAWAFLLRAPEAATKSGPSQKIAS